MLNKVVTNFVYSSIGGNSGIMKSVSFGGGAKKSAGGNWLLLFLVSLLIFVVKAYLVMYSYNYVVPRIFVDREVRTLSFTESVFLVILCNNLFR